MSERTLRIEALRPAPGAGRSQAAAEAAALCSRGRRPDHPPGHPHRGLVLSRGPTGPVARRTKRTRRRAMRWRSVALALALAGAAGGLVVPRGHAQEMDQCYDLRWGRMGCVQVE